jgi:DNA mismatch repair protein MutS
MPFDGHAGPFASILSADGNGSFVETQPLYFVDLNLDQVIDNIVPKDDAAVLRPVFWTPGRDEATVRFRQAVFADLERPAVIALVQPFRDEMRRVRANLQYADKVDRAVHRDAVMLRAAGLYVSAVRGLTEGMRRAGPRSSGLLSCLRYLETLLAEPGYTALEAGVARCRKALAAVEYGLLFRGDTVVIRRYADEPDYTDTVHDRFARFRDTQRPVPRPVAVPEDGGLDHIEAGILSSVSRLLPGPFGELSRFAASHPDFINPIVARLDREIGFYASYLTFIAPLRRAGLPFCTPSVSATDKETALEDGFDLALAAKLIPAGKAIVRNGFSLSGAERLLVVTGPNQGGKTTFARALGQAHHLAALGCPVPGTQARLFLPDRIFTHFERSESIANLRGKLEDELVDLHRTCTAMTADSVIVLNEVFNSTGLDDQLFLSTEVLRRILATGAIGACVTFLDALASLDETTVSMVSDVDPEDPANRTFRIVRRRADGMAYARALAEKRGLTFAQLKQRLAR